MKRRRWSYVLRYRNGRRLEVTDLPYKLEIGRVLRSRTWSGRASHLTVIERREA
jgi:hypothetical protein